jgi:hypothetical protein
MAVGAIAVITLALMPVGVALAHYVTDDMFYYLTAARNVAHGQALSLDGRSPTNGYHPLWMGICVLLEWLLGSNPDLVFHVALLLCAVMFIATGWLLYRAVLTTAGERLALVVGALFLCNYRMMTLPLGGLETAVYGLSVAILLTWLVRRGAAGLRSPRDAVILGLLLSLTYWSRLDALLLGVCVLAGMVLLTSGRPFAARAGLSVLAGLVSLAATLPWFYSSMRTVGKPLPRSGEAIAAFKGYEFQPGQSLTRNAVDFAQDVFAGNIRHLNGLANVLGVWPFAPDLASPLRYVGVLVILLVAVAVAVVVYRTRREPVLRPFLWIPVYALAQAAFYLAFSTLNARYLYPVIILMSFYVATAIACLGVRAANPARWATTITRATAVMLCFALIAGVNAYQRGYAAGNWHSLHRGNKMLADWLRDNTARDAVVGAFNAGIISYFSDRTVVNLDGVMNNAAIGAIKGRTLSSYIDGERIEYLADADTEITDFMNRFSGDPTWQRHWSDVYSVTIPTLGGKYQTRFVVMAHR